MHRHQDQQLQQIVDKTIMEADKDGDGKLSFQEFANMVANTVSNGFHTYILLPCFLLVPLLIRISSY